jgi:SAM-dependent methyltransferase
MAIRELRPAAQKAAVLDIGCYRGEFLESISGVIGTGVGIDPLAKNRKVKNLEFRKFTFENKLPFKKGSFDDIFMLAVLEHIGDKKSLVEECFRVLRKGGKCIITCPSPRADPLIAMLIGVGILHESDFFKQHVTPDNDEIVYRFKRAGFKLEKHETFQMGLNNVWVWVKELKK